VLFYCTLKPIIIQNVILLCCFFEGREVPQQVSGCNTDLHLGAGAAAAVTVALVSVCIAKVNCINNLLICRLMCYDKVVYRLSLCTPWANKKRATLLLPYICRLLTDLQNSFYWHTL